MAASKATKGKREALFVRIPAEDAARLDRAAFELKVSKQDLIGGLVARYVDPSSPATLDALRGLGEDAPAAGPRREPLALGHHALRPAAEPDVLTLAAVAALLQVEPAAVEALAEAGELPGRRIDGAWRFARRAVLDWLAAPAG